VETRGLAGEPGAYRLARGLDTIQMPATVQAILAARIDRLAPDLKRLLQAAAVVGKDVPVSVLEPIADLQGDDLRRGLTELQTAEFLYEARLFPDLEYTFKHALTHEIAYGGVLHDRRRALHAAIVEATERRYADRLGEHVEVLAHHAARGGLSAKAVRYLRLAGQKSLGRSASLEAIGFFDAARELLDTMPETSETLSESLDLHIVLGPALITLKGAAAPEVHAVYARAQDLVERLVDASRRFPVLWGLWFINYTMGRYQAARAAGQELLEDALAGDDSGRLIEAHHALWPTLLAMGESAAAVPHMERGIALYEKHRHAHQASMYAGHDPGVCCRYQLSLTRWLLGYPDAGVAVLRDALRLSEELQHAQTTTITLWFEATLHALRGEREASAQSAERLTAITGAYGFVHWADIAVVVSRASLNDRLDAASLSEIHRRLMEIRSSAWRRVVCLCLLTELCLEAGCPEVGGVALASMREEDRSAILAPEILRLEGELHLQDSPRAERCFRDAIEVARRRAEKSLELRATTSLARLLAARGKRDEASRMLSAVYTWFTEGLATRDLREARMLLDQLKA
jgi:tetratricopeptide (TPR) repeat protein